MIDTIAIMLEQHQFSIADHGKFSPDSCKLFEPPYYPLQNGRIVCVQNPSATDRATGIYKPRATLTKRIVHAGRFTITLRIEFSISKLFHGNNFMEVTDRDFIEIIGLLNECLKDMGIIVPDPFTTLPNALVSAVHYSKNFILHSNVTCAMILHELSKADVTQSLDLMKTDFRNGGHAFRLHANSFEVIWYDKIKDLQKSRVSEKRAIEDDSYCQQDLFTASPKAKHKEVFRMEVRLGNRTKIKDVLARVDSSCEPTFQNLFKTNLSQKVLTHFWQHISKSILFSSLNIENKTKAFHTLLKSNPDLKPNKALQVFAALVLIEEEGSRAFRNIYGQRGNTKAWSRLKSDLNSLDFSHISGFIASEQVTVGLAQFVPVIDFKDVN